MHLFVNSTPCGTNTTGWKGQLAVPVSRRIAPFLALGCNSAISEQREIINLLHKCNKLVKSSIRKLIEVEN